MIGLRNARRRGLVAGLRLMAAVVLGTGFILALPQPSFAYEDSNSCGGARASSNKGAQAALLALNPSVSHQEGIEENSASLSSVLDYYNAYGTYVQVGWVKQWYQFMDGPYRFTEVNATSYFDRDITTRVPLGSNYAYNINGTSGYYNLYINGGLQRSVPQTDIHPSGYTLSAAEYMGETMFTEDALPGTVSNHEDILTLKYKTTGGSWILAPLTAIFNDRPSVWVSDASVGDTSFTIYDARVP